MDFTFDFYRNLLRTIVNAGYSFAGYEIRQAGGKICILRHDVDFDLLKAAEFAVRERQIFEDLSISGAATYFISLSGNFYNPAAKSSRMAIEQIIASGAEFAYVDKRLLKL